MSLRIASTFEQLSEAGRRFFPHKYSADVGSPSLPAPGGAAADGGPVRLAASLEVLAVERQRSGDAVAAEALLRSALVLRDGAGGEAGGVGAVPTLDALAALCAARGANDEAAVLLERALRAVEGAGADRREIVGRLRTLAEAHAGRGAPAAAEALLERALALTREGGLGEQELAAILTSLAGVHSVLGRHAESERRLREALAVAGVDPLLRQLAVELAAQGRAAEAAAIARGLDDPTPTTAQLPRDEAPRLPAPQSGGDLALPAGGATLAPGTALVAGGAVREPGPVTPSSDGIKLFAAAAALTIVRSSPLQESGIARPGIGVPSAPREPLVVAERPGSNVLGRGPARVGVLRRHRTPIAAVAAVVVLGLIAGRTARSPRAADDDARVTEAAGAVEGGEAGGAAAMTPDGRVDGKGDARSGEVKLLPDTPFVVVTPSSARTAASPTVRDGGAPGPTRRRSALPSSITIDTRAIDESLRGRAESAVVRLPAIARPQGPLPPVDGRALGGRPPR
jgi:hypothetical protein